MWLIIGLALMALWALGFFLWHLGTIIWIALVAAVVAFVWHWVSHRNQAAKPKS